MNKSRWPAISIAERFWLKVYPRGDCWEWRGYLNAGTGYGRFNSNGRPVNAHAFAFALAKGQPYDYGVYTVFDHVCRHSWCVKPSHIVLATRSENLKRSEAYERKAAAKTCIRGHPWIAETTQWRADGRRYCRICARLLRARIEADQ